MADQKPNSNTQNNNKRFWLWIIAFSVLLFGIWQLLSHKYPEEEKELRTQIRKTVKDMFPEKAAEFSETFGLFLFDGERGLSRNELLARKTVVIVHGLNDPGKVWMNLDPELTKKELNVLFFVYPNDQPVVESSRLFYKEMKDLKEFGVDRIYIVAHSMGGLVIREMLTSPEFHYKKSVKENLIPIVDTFIMLATPNHGSEMARFRLIGELRDHLARLSKGNTSWQAAILDGTGEAKIDLLPNSRFLIELNK